MGQWSRPLVASRQEVKATIPPSPFVVRPGPAGVMRRRVKGVPALPIGESAEIGSSGTGERPATRDSRS